MQRINVDSIQSIGITSRTSTLVNIDAPKRKVNTPILNLNNITEHGDIIVCHNVLNRDVCENIIQACEGAARLYGNMWEKAVTIGEDTVGNDPNSPRQNLILHIGTSPKLKIIDSLIWRTFLTTIDTISNTMLPPHGFNLTCDEGYSLLRYGPNNYYKEHTDYHNTAVRVLSGLLYLNDDFEGGEIDFRRQNYRIKPTAGTIIFFPSSWTHPHTAMPVTRGIRYNIVSWWR